MDYIDRTDNISILAPARGRHAVWWSEETVASISILAPARGATFLPSSYKPDTSHFNSRPREGGDIGQAALGDAKDISILAPARGATFHACAWHIVGDISILAPARGATALRLVLRLVSLYFNSRPREGGDP